MSYTTIYGFTMLSVIKKFALKNGLIRIITFACILLFIIFLGLAQHNPAQAEHYIDVPQLNILRTQAGLPPLTGNDMADIQTLQYECQYGIQGSCQVLQWVDFIITQRLQSQIQSPSFTPNIQCDRSAKIRCESSCRDEMEKCKKSCPDPVSGSVVAASICGNNCINRAYDICIPGCRSYCP